MSATTEIPLVIEPDAAERVAELGLQTELQMMLDRVKQTFPGMHKLRVEMENRSHLGEDPGIIIWAHREGLTSDYDPTEEEFGRWCAERLSPEACWRMGVLSIYEDRNGR